MTPLDPAAPFPTGPDTRALDRLADHERRLARLERGERYLGAFTAGTTTLTFSDIPQTFRHLRVLWMAQSQRAGFQNTGGRARINNNAANFYSFGYHYNAAPGGATTRFATSIYVGQVPAASRTSDDLVTTVAIDFPFYSRPDLAKCYAVTSSGDDGTNSLWARVQGAFVQDALPITRIDLFDDVLANLGPRSRAELWAL